MQSCHYKRPELIFSSSHFCTSTRAMLNKRVIDFWQYVKMWFSLLQNCFNFFFILFCFVFSCCCMFCPLCSRKVLISAFYELMDCRARGRKCVGVKFLQLEYPRKKSGVQENIKLKEARVDCVWKLHIVY